MTRPQRNVPRHDYSIKGQHASETRHRFEALSLKYQQVAESSALKRRLWGYLAMRTALQRRFPNYVFRALLRTDVRADGVITSVSNELAQVKDDAW